MADLGSKLRLHFQNEENWLQFSEWAEFLIRLGSAFPEMYTPHHRLVMAVSVPTRAYVTPLIASGVVLHQALNSSEDSTPEIHFHELCKMVRHSVTYAWESKSLKGLIVGCETVGGERFIKIQVQHRHFGGRTIGVKLRDAHKITLLSESFGELPKRQSGKQVAAPSALLTSILNAQQTQQFVSDSQAACAVIGRLNVLKHEVSARLLANQMEDGSLGQGVLDDWLRVRSASDPTKPFRCEFRTAQSRKPPRFVLGKVPPVIIFDGAGGFLKWRENFQSSHWIVVLDRTDTATQDAADALNQEYVLKRSEMELVLALGKVPAGIELMVYQVKRI